MTLSALLGASSHFIYEAIIGDGSYTEAVSVALHPEVDEFSASDSCVDRNGLNFPEGILCDTRRSRMRASCNARNDRKKRAANVVAARSLPDPVRWASVAVYRWRQRAKNA